MEKTTKAEDIELYFIQFLFMKNKELLKKEYRDLYDAMLDRYVKIYLEGKKCKVDLMTINKKYLSIFGIKTKK